MAPGTFKETGHSSIVHRLLMPPTSYIFQGLPSNLFFHWAAMRKIDPVDYY